MTLQRIYVQENNDAYVFIGSWIIHFVDGIRHEMIRLIADKDVPDAYHGVDGNRYHLGESVILITHPLTKKRVFFDADMTMTVPPEFVSARDKTINILVPRGSPIFDDAEDYVSTVVMDVRDGTPRLFVKTFGGIDVLLGDGGER